MSSLRRDAKETGRNIQFLVNKLLGEHYGQGSVEPVEQLPAVVKVKAPVKRFVPPEYEAVASAFFELGSEVCQDDAKAFMAYYESNGWKVGKNKMKNWKAAAIGWHKRNEERKAAAPKAFGQKTDSTRDLTLEEELTDTSWAG
jgi:hypothetical protein